jgi:hypothetical protein
MEARDEVNKLLASATSVSVHASEESLSENKDDLESVTSKIRASDPSIIYSREYAPEGLIANIAEQNQTTTFAITPYENRIIIPRIGENIPLVDVEMGHGESFEKMHEVFMEELRK